MELVIISRENQKHKKNIMDAGEILDEEYDTFYDNLTLKRNQELKEKGGLIKEEDKKLFKDGYRYYLKYFVNDDERAKSLSVQKMVCSVKQYTDFVEKYFSGIEEEDYSIFSWFHYSSLFVAPWEFYKVAANVYSNRIEAESKMHFELSEKEYKEKFETAGITYFYTLVDDAIARVMKSKGGFIWACKNYDGDVFSDMLATAFGSLAMMTSVLVSPHGYYEYEAAHGTIPRHYHKYLNGEKTSTNPIATIFAWTGALAKRGELDGLPLLSDFARRAENAVLSTVASGKMTGDLALLSSLPSVQVLDLEEFLQEVASKLSC